MHTFRINEGFQRAQVHHLRWYKLASSTGQTHYSANKIVYISGFISIFPLQKSRKWLKATFFAQISRVCARKMCIRGKKLREEKWRRLEWMRRETELIVDGSGRCQFQIFKKYEQSRLHANVNLIYTMSVWNLISYFVHVKEFIRVRNETNLRLKE